MRAYSSDLRERIVRAVAEGQPMRTAARCFGVWVSTIKRLVLLHEHTGTLTPRPIPGRARSLNEDILRQRMEAAPDATAGEHCRWWAETQGQVVHETTMWRAMHRLGWTHKKKSYSKRAR
jgi:transposase